MRLPSANYRLVADSRPLNLRVESLLPDDLDQVMELEKQCFPAPWSRGMFEQEMEHPWAVLETVRLLDEEGARVIQPVAGYSDYWLVYDEVHLLNIAVRPDLQRNGIGTLLMDRVFDTAGQANCRQVVLEVRPSNRAAMTLYRRLGFRQVGIRKGYYADSGEDAIVMVRPVGTADL